MARAQPEADLPEAADYQFLFEGLDFDLDVDAVLGGQPWHGCGADVAHPHRHRPERILDPPGEHGEVAGPAAVIGHHGETACQLIRKGHPASLGSRAECCHRAASVA